MMTSIFEWGVDTRERFRVAIDTSVVGTTTRTCVRYVKHSHSYRWLTTEPDPDVIVIDLRRTYTVGPVLRLVDWFVSLLGDAASTSLSARIAGDLEGRFVERPLRVVGWGALGGVTIAALGLLMTGGLSAVSLGVLGVVAAGGVLGTRSTTTLDELRKTEAWNYVERAFEPPSPPDGTRRDGAKDESSDRADES